MRAGTWTGWMMAAALLVGPGASSAAFAQDEEASETTTTTTSTESTPQNEGFQIDKIELVSGDFSFADRFEAGLSSIGDVHRVNTEDCSVYNRETPAVESASDVEEDADGVDATSDSDVVSEPGCVLEGDSPIVRIHWSASFTTSSTGYRWTAKVGSCNAGELTEETDDCVLVTESVSDIASSGNTFEVPLAWLIGTLGIGADENTDVRSCCAALDGFEDDVRVHVFTGFESDELSVAYDTLKFAYDYESPKQPSGVTIQTLGETLRVQWSDVSDGDEEISYTVYHAAESFEDPALAVAESAGSSTELELQSLPLNADRYIRVGAVDAFDNVGELSAQYVATPAETLDGWEFYKSGGGGEDGGFCFIATAAHGSYMAPHVQILREFRDRHLLQSKLGREFVAFYYVRGAAWADWIRESPWRKTLVRALLVPLVAFAWTLQAVGGAGFAAMCFGTLAVGVYWRRRKTLEDATSGSQEMA